jgi:hypothetical protein
MRSCSAPGPVPSIASTALTTPSEGVDDLSGLRSRCAKYSDDTSRRIGVLCFVLAIGLVVLSGFCLLFPPVFSRDCLIQMMDTQNSSSAGKSEPQCRNVKFAGGRLRGERISGSNGLYYA